MSKHPEEYVKTAIFTPKQTELLDLLVKTKGNQSKASRELGLSMSAIRSRIKTMQRNIPRNILLKEYPSIGHIFHLEKSETPPEVEFVEPLTADTMLEGTLAKLGYAVGCLTQSKLRSAKVSELNSLVKTLFDVTQVLQGKPTSISHSENVKKLKELVPALVQEAARRGITLEGEVLDVDVRGTRRGASAHPPGGQGLGPVKPRVQSDFSKISEILS
jgi:hypothetical protein